MNKQLVARTQTRRATKGPHCSLSTGSAVTKLKDVCCVSQLYDCQGFVRDPNIKTHPDGDESVDTGPFTRPDNNRLSRLAFLSALIIQPEQTGGHSDSCTESVC